MTRSLPAPPSPGAVLRAFFRHKGKMALCFLLVLGTATAATIRAPRSYRSQARLFLRLGRENVTLDPTATLGEGALQPWSHAHVADYFGKLVQALGEELGFDMDTPWEKLTPKARPSTLSAATRAGSGAVAISAALSAGEPYLSASARYTDDMT